VDKCPLHSHDRLTKDWTEGSLPWGSAKERRELGADMGGLKQERCSEQQGDRVP